MMKIGMIVFGFLMIFQFNTRAQAVDAYFDYAPFYAKGTGVFVETYLTLNEQSLHYILTKDSVYEASVEITMLFKNVDEVIEYRRYNVVSPPLEDSSIFYPRFIDLQRISIPEGIYNFQLIVKDNYGADSIKPFKTNQLITVNLPEKELALSGIEFLESYNPTDKATIFNKDDFECLPYHSDNFDKSTNFLRFYAELYNGASTIGPLEDFLIEIHIEETHTSKPIKAFGSVQSQQAVNKNVIFKEINIEKLPSGNYYLVIQIRDNKNKILLASKKYFKRQGNVLPKKTVDLKSVKTDKTFVIYFSNEDSLSYYIQALRPIADESEQLFIDSLLSHSSLKVKQQFFCYFWKSRNESDSESEWNIFYAKLKIVEMRYKTTTLRGFETAPGIVFLQQGPPNSINNTETASLKKPIEIWNYYNIANQANIDFVFYIKSKEDNVFELLHSNLKGEKSTINWEIKLDEKIAE